VIPDSKRLHVSAVADKGIVPARDKVRIKLDVRDASQSAGQGRGRARRADEGGLSLVAYKTPDRWQSSDAPWGSASRRRPPTSVSRIASSLETMMTAAWAMEEDEDRRTRCGRGLANRVLAPGVHTTTPATPSSRSSHPTQLTAFRVMAVAGRFRRPLRLIESRFRVANPSRLHPILPRFFSTGDVARIGAVVQNDTRHKWRVTVVAKIQGIKAHRRAQAPPYRSRAARACT